MGTSNVSVRGMQRYGCKYGLGRAGVGRRRRFGCKPFYERSLFFLLYQEEPCQKDGFEKSRQGRGKPVLRI